MASNSYGMQSSVAFGRFISYFRGFKCSTNGSHANHGLRARSLDDIFARNSLTLHVEESVEFRSVSQMSWILFSNSSGINCFKRQIQLKHRTTRRVLS